MRKSTLITSFVFIALFPIANFSLAADNEIDKPDSAPPLSVSDTATLANASLDGVIFPAAAGAEQQIQLDEAINLSPDAGATPGATSETTGKDQAPANPLLLASAVGQTAQEAALLGTGAPLEAGEAGGSPNHDMAQCFTLFKEFAGVGFQEISQGLEAGNLPSGITTDMAKGMVETFNRVHESFEKLSNAFENAAFKGGQNAGLPGLGSLPAGALPVFVGPEGQALPMPMVGIGDFGNVLTGALSGMDPQKFAEGMTKMIEARQEAFQQFTEQKGFDPNSMPGDMPNPANFASPGEFLAQFGGTNDPSFQPGAGMMGGQHFMPDGQTNSPFHGDSDFGTGIQGHDFREISGALAQAIAADLTQQFVARQVILQNLPPEALNTLQALNDNFTAADLTFLQNNPGQNITRAFSTQITHQYKNTASESVAFPGDEHVHVIYSLNNAPPLGDVPVTHVDANVTAIHSSDHSQTAQLPAEAAHIPGIQA